MRLDLAINPFDAEVPDMLQVARLAERCGCAAVWVTDHFSGAVVGRRWSRDPFVCLAAIASATERIDLGLLVANMVNRHPAQLASAINSLQSLAPDRVRLGIGSGAAPGSRFAVEHESIGRPLAAADDRRRRLVDSIAALRAIWNGEADFEADEVGFRGLGSITDGRPCPPIVVGASAWPTIAVALDVADGVNIRSTAHLLRDLERLGPLRPPSFEVSVLDSLSGRDVDLDVLAVAGCDRLILGVSAPFDLAAIELALSRLHPT